MHHTATHCNNTRHSHVCHTSAAQRVTLYHTASHCIIFATHCNTLQHTATHSNTLQQHEAITCVPYISGAVCINWAKYTSLSFPFPLSFVLSLSLSLSNTHISPLFPLSPPPPSPPQSYTNRINQRWSVHQLREAAYSRALVCHTATHYKTLQQAATT